MSIRRWLDIVTTELERVDQRLEDDADPVELTADGEVAYRYLLGARENLRRRSMILEGAVRRMLDILTGEHRTRRAYRRRSRVPDTDPNSYQEVAEHTHLPSGTPTAPSSEAGDSSPGYVYCLLTRGMTLIGN